MSRVGTTACGRELGDQLRRNRRRAGIQAHRMARMLGWDPSKVSRVEAGRHAISEPEVVHYLARCGVLYEQMSHMIELARHTQRDLGYWASPCDNLSDSLRSLIYHETTAAWSISYEPQVIPGLLQTPEYAATLLVKTGTPENRIPSRLAARMQRQTILHVPDAATYRFYIHEDALHPIGDHRIMNEQLLRLTLLANQPNIIIRVVPGGDESVLGGSFVLLGYLHHRPLIFLDGHHFGLFLEDKGYVDPYRQLLPMITEAALDAGQSRELLAARASRHDRVKGDPDEQVAQEQS